MSDTAAKPRPQFRNIGLAQVAFSYRLPLAGKLSILHRISGILLFLCLPLVIVPLFAASVAAPQTFAWIASIAANPIVKLVFLVLVWGYLHHFCAGIRYLLLDLHIGIDKLSAKKSAGVVFGVSLALTLVFGLKLFGVL
ncbi:MULTISPECIES: succinate dehydrogenase, cytochrome b556 subunit [Achromobacter]|jgi:succinate dehydrogenase / fumarate reductase cytochrome b subunit|uniref:Succinate dehydrogenase cytochrome b556 subunit n=1 Tax=Achromobacter spanius TaxID=217203 RepID=A0ABY8GSU0_9BURK|nr:MULTISPECIES: succinate dehydrogenase, cytochrome b556 subunit [Achromobacter]SPT37149.1 Succinate dehydrogenase cytochrome b556 subunit [Achromobacter denitrificans]AUA59495.1 succinate dehydrogenase, cytochrome b556 subunit [Achromobacter spanius]WAI82842.1 succinate dehydrogenase, cytochrome b556 subunit [Achromobacter spanius]WEX92926.1 succinate dehydrogenase, cytochrome b556 subunit [Achromobacter sp. SS2-2022]WFP07919.1 succinate dehydrogenase, cytochrome b556 subunit [Achromobacter 